MGSENPGASWEEPTLNLLGFLAAPRATGSHLIHAAARRQGRRGCGLGIGSTRMAPVKSGRLCVIVRRSRGEHRRTRPAFRSEETEAPGLA